MTRQYQTARAFRAALENRLNQQAREAGQDVTRLRRLVGFERFLARLFVEEHPPWLLKGGIVGKIWCPVFRKPDLDRADHLFLFKCVQFASVQLFLRIRRTVCKDSQYFLSQGSGYNCWNFFCSIGSLVAEILTNL